MVGLINLAFSLLAVSRIKPVAQSCWSHGKLILVRLSKSQPETAGHILSQLADKLAQDSLQKQYAGIPFYFWILLNSCHFSFYPSTYTFIHFFTWTLTINYILLLLWWKTQKSIDKTKWRNHNPAFKRSPLFFVPDCLYVLCKLTPASVERCTQLSTILENCQPTVTEYKPAACVLDAVHPLLNYSTRTRDVLVMVCRKGLYSR